MEIPKLEKKMLALKAKIAKFELLEKQIQRDARELMDYYSPEVDKKHKPRTLDSNNYVLSVLRRNLLRDVFRVREKKRA